MARLAQHWKRPLLLLGLVILAAGVYFSRTAVREPVGADAVAARDSTNVDRELDFGFVELDPGGQAVAIPSFKNGGPMVVYAGDQLHFEAMGDDPIPPLELQAGNAKQQLPGSAGAILISGPPQQPLPVALRAEGSRHSLPGGAPPRIAVKVQLFGPALAARP